VRSFSPNQNIGDKRPRGRTLRTGGLDANQLTGPAILQRAKKRALEHGEHSGVSPDTEREHNYHTRRKARRVPHLAQSIMNILKHRVHDPPRSLESKSAAILVECNSLSFFDKAPGRNATTPEFGNALSGNGRCRFSRLLQPLETVMLS
jgi:hypothetical protein